MKFMALVFITLMSFLSLSNAIAVESSVQSTKSYSIYLVRHAEKQTQQKNPALTECGHQRAAQLATTLELTGIKQIYSTQLLRTEQTAQPLAEKLALDVLAYSPKELGALAQKVKQQKLNTLIVGHSNTTPQLTSLIAEIPVEPITEQEYQMLYQITFSGEHATLSLLKQPLTCQ